MENLRKNSSGYPDPTAGQALEHVLFEEEIKEIDDIACKLVHIVKLVLDIWGFELAERVKIRHRKTGRVYK